MTAKETAEQWRDRFLTLARLVEDRTEETVCLEAAAILDDLCVELERLCTQRG